MICGYMKFSSKPPSIKQNTSLATTRISSSYKVVFIDFIFHAILLFSVVSFALPATDKSQLLK